MQEERVKLVNLKPSCREYQEVQNKFKKTCPSFIIEKVKSYGGDKVNSWAENINILSKYLFVRCLQSNTPFICQSPSTVQGGYKSNQIS